jgi:hypothetical protein
VTAINAHAMPCINSDKGAVLPAGVWIGDPPQALEGRKTRSKSAT